MCSHGRYGSTSGAIRKCKDKYWVLMEDLKNHYLCVTGITVRVLFSKDNSGEVDNNGNNGDEMVTPEF